MDREQLINLLQSIDFQDVISFKLNYRKEKPSRFNDEENRIESICYGEDFIDCMQRELNHIHQRIDRIGEDVFKLNNKEEK